MEKYDDEKKKKFNIQIAESMIANMSSQNIVQDLLFNFYQKNSLQSGILCLLRQMYLKISEASLFVYDQRGKEQLDQKQFEETLEEINSINQNAIFFEYYDEYIKQLKIFYNDAYDFMMFSLKFAEKQSRALNIVKEKFDAIKKKHEYMKRQTQIWKNFSQFDDQILNMMKKSDYIMKYYYFNFTDFNISNFFLMITYLASLKLYKSASFALLKYETEKHFIKNFDEDNYNAYIEKIQKIVYGVLKNEVSSKIKNIKPVQKSQFSDMFLHILYLIKIKLDTAFPLMLVDFTKNSYSYQLSVDQQKIFIDDTKKKTRQCFMDFQFDCFFQPFYYGDYYELQRQLSIKNKIYIYPCQSEFDKQSTISVFESCNPAVRQCDNQTTRLINAYVAMDPPCIYDTDATAFNMDGRKLANHYQFIGTKTIGFDGETGDEDIDRKRKFIQQIFYEAQTMGWDDNQNRLLQQICLQMSLQAQIKIGNGEKWDTVIFSPLLYKSKAVDNPLWDVISDVSSVSDMQMLWFPFINTENDQIKIHDTNCMLCNSTYIKNLAHYFFAKIIFDQIIKIGQKMRHEVDIRVYNSIFPIYQQQLDLCFFFQYKIMLFCTGDCLTNVHKGDFRLEDVIIIDEYQINTDKFKPTEALMHTIYKAKIEIQKIIFQGLLIAKQSFRNIHELDNHLQDYYENVTDTIVDSVYAVKNNVFYSLYMQSFFTAKYNEKQILQNTFDRFKQIFIK